MQYQYLYEQLDNLFTDDISNNKHMVLQKDVGNAIDGAYYS